MGVDDLLIKKYLKKYLIKILRKYLTKPTKGLFTKEDIVQYLAERAETLYEEIVLK